MKKILILLLAWGFFMPWGSTQSTLQPRQLDSDDKGIIYDKELTFDARFHTNGLAFAVNYGRIKTYYLTKYYHFELGRISHPKEFKQSYDIPNINSPGNSRSFIFGKQNDFFVLRAGYGIKRYYSEKAKKRGLAVGMTYEFGPSLGILKPYYLEFNRVQDNTNNPIIVSERYTPETEASFLNVNTIHGAAPFTKGLGEISVIPGIHAKIAAHFDWGAFDEFVKAIEAGIMIDVYPKKVPIMVSEENRPFFVNLYLSLQLGKRW
ncbi:MAG: hypothetical protein AB8G15_20835 [Saprospiraceae bacterium]